MPPLFYIMVRLFLSALLITAFSFPANSAIIYVNYAATGQNNGTSWPNALNEIRSALQTAKYGDEIWVAKGTYNTYGQDNTGVFARPIIKSGVRILGGFQGIETTAIQRNWEENPTILTSYILPDSFHITKVLLCFNADSTTVLDGFTVRDGAAFRTSSTSCEDYPGSCEGGGLWIYAGENPELPTSLHVFNCKFINNLAESGGAVCINYSSGYGTIEFKNCVFEANYGNSTGTGAGVYVLVNYDLLGPVKVTVDSCVFRGNMAYSVGGMGIDNFNPNLEFHVRNTLFINNESVVSNGALFVGNWGKANAYVKQCIFDRNRAGTVFFEPGTGGAMLGQNFKVDRCVFTGNSARFGGAIFAGNVEVTNSLFASNYASKSGGALRLTGITGEKCLLLNNTFVNNYSFENGGLMQHENRVRDTMINCIFWNNRAAGLGDFIYSEGGLDFYMDHCLIDADSLADLQDGLLLLNPNVPYNYLTAGPNMLWNQNPLLRDTLQGDYRLMLPSPARNIGNAGWVQRFGLQYDLNGEPRISDGFPDLGAYETTQLQAFTNQTDVSCFGRADGQAWVQPQGGFSPYQFRWNNGVWASSITDLPPGSYTVTVTDADLSSDTLEIAIVQPLPLSVVPVVTKASGPNIPDGSVILQSVGGGTEPYTFKWNTGDQAAHISNLLPGFYQLTMTDAHGCDTLLTVEVSATVGWVDWDGRAFTVVLAPNVVRSGDFMVLRAQSEEAGICEYQIVDALGQVCDRQSFSIATGESWYSKAGTLLPGAYAVCLTNSHGQKRVLRLWVH